MQAPVFGKSSLISFTATDRRGKAIAPYSLVSARIYASKPSEAEIEDDSNTLATALAVNSATWQTGTSLNEKLIPFPAIADGGENKGERDREEYWIVTRFRFQDAGQIQSDVKTIWFERSTGILSRFGILPEDLFKLDTAFNTYDSVDGFSVSDKIELAEIHVGIDLESKNVKLEDVQLSDASELVRIKAAILCYADLTNQTNDVWERKLTRLEALYEALQTKIKIATGTGGNIDPDQKSDFTTVYLDR